MYQFMKFTSILTPLLVVGISLFLFVGCTPANDPTVRAANRGHLSGDGEYIGTFKDKRNLYRYYIENGSAHTHYVYVVRAENGVEQEKSINYEVSQGKTTRTETIVLIDGVEYIKKQ